MKATEAFPSKYISASDLQGNDVVVKITHITTEEIGGKQKFICYFAGKKKGLVLNKTNWNTIVRITGMDDSDDWTGAEVCLFETMVDFQGDSVPAVRIKNVPRRDNGAQQRVADERGQQQPMRRADPISSGPARIKPPLDEHHGDPLDNEAPF
jgi:hypothetical protein